MKLPFAAASRCVTVREMLFSFGVAAVGVLAPRTAFQQTVIVPCDGPDCTLEQLLELPVRIFNMLLSFAGVIFLLVIAWAGIRMMIYSFSDTPEPDLIAAKNTLRYGIFGFIVIATAYVIVNLIFTILGLQPASGVGQWLINYGLFEPPPPP